jgi:D-aminopeptidase
MKRQVVIIADMEGASGIFENNSNAFVPGTDEWKTYGRVCITSDVSAVCAALKTCGIDDIFVYDEHYAGDSRYNIILEELPENIKLFDVPDRRMFWRRIRGQVKWDLFGIITVGQHAGNGTADGYFAHTLQTPPIKSLSVNGNKISEIGLAAYNFYGAKYIANIGCAASHGEARSINETVTCITVKDKKKRYEPAYTETCKLIEEQVINAINDSDSKTHITVKEPCEIELVLEAGYEFYFEDEIPIKCRQEKQKVVWYAPEIETGLEFLDYFRSRIKKTID